MADANPRALNNGMAEKFQAVIFDLDGTLWDSRASVAESWNEIIAKELPGHEPFTAELIGAQMGRTLIDIGRSVFSGQSETEIRRLIDLCCRHENEYIARHGGLLADGLESALGELKKDHRLFIVSNCQSGYIEAFFEAHGVGDYFDDFQDNESSGLLKAGNIRLIMERNGITSAVYVGDTALDGSSAREAGVPFILARYGFGDCDDFDGSADSFADIPDAVKRLENA